MNYDISCLVTATLDVLITWPDRDNHREPAMIAYGIMRVVKRLASHDASSLLPDVQEILEALSANDEGERPGFESAVDMLKSMVDEFYQ